LLWKIIHEEFKGDLKAALAYLIDQHPAGWSSLENRNCYCHPSRSKDADFKKHKPEPAQIFTHENVVKPDTDIEYLFIFDEEKNRLFVRDVAYDAESLAELAEPEPDWRIIECGEHFKRCKHYAWFHKLLPRTSNLSTETWLGLRPLEFHDAVAFIINGKRWVSTGCGGNSNFLNQASGTRHPHDVWVATVKAKNGKRIDVPVARIVKGEYKPLPGVVWVFPPTVKEPNETTCKSEAVILA
jgi:hypothetical protein